MLVETRRPYQLWVALFLKLGLELRKMEEATSKDVFIFALYGGDVTGCLSSCLSFS